MKCEKCGGEWTVEPEKSVGFCPYCGGKMQTTSDNVIKEMRPLKRFYFKGKCYNLATTRIPQGMQSSVAKH